jgi:single-strand DNA-binding protein
MFETPLTVVGRIITDLRRRRVGDQEVISFRMASNSRRRSADGTWEPGNTLYITEYDDRDGVRRSSLEMRATSVGPDLSQAIVSIIERVNHAGHDTETPSAAEDTPPAEADEEDKALPLSA